MNLRRGVRVRIAPFRGGRCFAKAAHLDGAAGEIKSTKGHGEDLEALVEIESKGHGGPALVPARALRPIEPR